MLPFVLLVALHWSFGPPFQSGDQAHYMLHARALAEGRPYGEIGYIRTPFNAYVGPAVYPPGYPLTLAPLVAVFGSNTAPMKAVVALSMLAAALIAGMTFARRDHLWLGLGVALMFGVALEHTHAVNSPAADAGFIALIWAIVFLADRPGRWGAGRIAAITVLGLWAVAYRLAGVALGPAFLLFGLVRLRDLGVRPLIPLGIWGTLMLVGSSVVPLENALGGVFLLDPRLIVGHIGAFFYEYRYALLEAHLYPFPWEAWSNGYHIVAAAVAVLGLLVWMRTAWRRFAFWFGAAYICMLLLVPVKDGRYLLPVVPLLMFALLNGIRVLALALARVLGSAAAPRWSPARSTAVAGAVAAAIGVAAALTHAPLPRQAGLTDLPETRELFSRLTTMRADEPLRVAFANPRLLTWETRVPAMPTFVAPPAAAREELRAKRISHLIIDDLGIYARGDRSMRDLVAAYPESFRLEFTNPHFQMYRVEWDPAPPRDL